MRRKVAAHRLLADVMPASWRIRSLVWTRRFILISAAAIAVAGAPTFAHAQRGHHGGARPVVSRPVLVTPYYSPYLYDPFFWGFYGWGSPVFYPPAFYGATVVQDSSARLQVTPRETEVYVDGYRAGTVDDFDGFSQRLRVAPGEHVIDLYLEGHKPVSQTILFAPGETYRIRHTMEPLPAGEAAPPRPTPRPAAAPQAAAAYDALGRPIAGLAPPASTSSAIAIRVQPVDAVILVDGERWQSSSGERLEIQVTPGAHRIDVQKDGYQPFTTNVQVRPGETTTVNVSLTRGGEQ